MKYFRVLAYVAIGLFICCDFACIPFHDSSFSSEHLLQSKASELGSTVVVPHVGVPIKLNENVIWCSTFQLAWNEACELVGEDIHMYQEPSFVELLNKRTSKRSDLDEESFVALAGHVGDGIFSEIRAELNNKFKGAASPRIIPDEMGMRPQDIIAYAYLFKNLEFPNKFEKLDNPISFANSKVRCFGVGESYKAGHIDMCGQVLIHDYKSSEDFVIELLTNSPIDQVILAKINHDDTLESTIANVLDRISEGESSNMQPGDILKVPKFNFDIHRKYMEIEHKKLIIKNPAIAQDLMVLSAEQLIRFQMDEEGVKLLSESSMSFGCSAAYQPFTEHIMIFDGPFLVLMKNKESNVPYFAMWISNPELLIPWK